PNLKFFNYLKDGFIFQLLKRENFDAFYLKDDFSIHFMLYLIYANKVKKKVAVISHGLKHSSDSLRNASRRKFMVSRILLNVFRYGKLLIDCLVIGYREKRVMSYLKMFYWNFKYDKFTYV